MTKSVVAAKVAQQTGLNRKDTMEAFEVFIECIKGALKEEEKVSLVGFGTFYVKVKNARNGRNPRTGERIQIPRKVVATFKPGKSFRELVNRGLSTDPDPAKPSEPSPSQEPSLG